MMRSANFGQFGSARGTFIGVLALVLLTLGTTQSYAQERYSLTDGVWEKQYQIRPDSPEGKLLAIRKLIAEDKFKAAEKAADEWIKNNENHPLLAEALLVRGDAKVGRRHYFRSLFDYELMVRQFPGSEHFHLALEREYEIAQLFAKGVKRRWLKMRILPAQGEAEELMIRIQERAPGSAIGEKASLALADFYFRRSEMTTAAEAYELFLENYPDSRSRERAMLRLVESSLATFKGPQYDPTGLLDSAERLRQFQDEFPASAERLGADALLVRINESLARKDLTMAQWYDGQERDVAALALYRRIVREHASTAAAQDAAKRLAELGEPLVEQPLEPRNPQQVTN